MADSSGYFDGGYIDPKLLSPSPNPSLASPLAVIANDSSLNPSMCSSSDPRMQLPNDLPQQHQNQQQQQQYAGYEPDGDYNDVFDFTNFNDPVGSDLPSFVVDNSASQTPESCAEDAFPLTPSSDRTGSHPRPETIASMPKSHITRGRPTISTAIPTSVTQSNVGYNRLDQTHPTPQSGSASGTASGTASGRSSEDSLSASVQQSSVLTGQSPRLIISYADQNEKNDDANTKNPHLLGAYHGGPTPSIASDMATCHDDASAIYAPSRNASQTREGSLLRHRGIAPPHRTGEEVESINSIARKHEIEERKKGVDQWLQADEGFGVHDVEVAAPAPDDYSPPDPLMEIPLGDNTENMYLPDQTYINARPEDLDKADIQIISKRFPWESGPRFHPIEKPAENGQRSQPESSQAAIALYTQRFMSDNQSIISVAATTGTFRRRGSPEPDDYDHPEAEVLNGSIFKRLSLKDKTGRGHVRSKSGVLLQGLSNLIRSPSTGGNSKRARSRNPEEDCSSGQNTPTETEHRPSPPSINIPGRSGSIKRSLGVTHMVASVGGSIASIGSSHARNGSVSTISSPKISRLKGRGRSKSDAGRSGTHGLTGLLKQHGGMPGTNLSVSTAWSPSETTVGTIPSTAPLNKADDSSDDEEGDDEDMAGLADETDDIKPDMAGFQAHIRKLNPDILPANEFLIGRIAHQQLWRYKNLLNIRKKHIQTGVSCANSTYCVHNGGGVTLLNINGAPRVVDESLQGTDEEALGQEGLVTPETFPVGIPMPPTKSLPAEFECRLCFQKKKFNKPSDWTKHVQEDIQPFTCTWDGCRDSKAFKRKADWVRHENEGHRHLEWWTCDVPECNHTCYRRDNFLQHLVREHKCAEPKSKAKGSSKRSAAKDPTTERVVRCHVNTQKSPESEPCRFCGKMFLSWKKLTVHMAKHMEHISFPVIALAAKAELTEDTIISPVQDAPPRPFPVPTKEESSAMFQNINKNFTVVNQNAAYQSKHVNMPFSFPANGSSSRNNSNNNNNNNNGMNGQFNSATQPIHMGYGQTGMSLSPLVTTIQTPSTVSIGSMGSPNVAFGMGQQTTPQMMMPSSPAHHLMPTMVNPSPIPPASLDSFLTHMVTPQSQYGMTMSMEEFGDGVVINDSGNANFMNNQPLFYSQSNGIGANIYGGNMQNPNPNPNHNHNHNNNNNQFYRNM